MIDSLRDIVRHPATILSAAVASLSSLVGIPYIDPVLMVVWANVGQLFTAFSIGAFTIVPNIELPVAEAGEAVQITAILLGIAYAAKIALGVVQQATNRLD